MKIFQQRIILLFIIYCNLVLSKNIVILVLGSHMEPILNDRIKTALNFAETKEEKITWYLSGGIKNHGKISEASKMKKLISSNSKWKFEIDERSRNTAENFANFKKWIKKQPSSDVYIATSYFHYQRANKIINGIIGNINVNWLLGELDYPNCHNDEIIHSRNIDNDIRKAINYFQFSL